MTDEKVARGAPVCPQCRWRYRGYSALSRADRQHHL
jgi:hypothetical protein